MENRVNGYGYGSICTDNRIGENWGNGLGNSKVAEANQMPLSLQLGIMRTNDTMRISRPFLFSQKETLPFPNPLAEIPV